MAREKKAAPAAKKPPRGGGKRPKNNTTKAAPPQLPPEPPRPTSTTDPKYQEWLAYVCEHGEFVAPSGAPENKANTTPTISTARVIPRIQARPEDGLPPGTYHTENVDGIGIAATTREALGERREGVLLGKEHGREQGEKATLGALEQFVKGHKEGKTPPPPVDAGQGTAMPRRDRYRRQIRLGDDLRYEYKRHAPAQFVILGALRKAGWPPAINNPVTHFSPRDTVEALNERLVATRLRLRRLANDTLIGWRITPV